MKINLKEHIPDIIQAVIVDIALLVHTDDITLGIIVGILLMPFAMYLMTAFTAGAVDHFLDLFGKDINVTGLIIVRIIVTLFMVGEVMSDRRPDYDDGPTYDDYMFYNRIP